jgi:hypothetical protein
MSHLNSVLRIMVNKRKFLEGSDSDSENGPPKKISKVDEEEMKESSLYPFLNTDVIKAYSLPGTNHFLILKFKAAYLEGSKLEKSNLATIIQLDKENLKCLCFSDESKQKEFSIFIKFNEEGSISKVNCDCLYKEGKEVK